MSHDWQVVGQLPDPMSGYRPMVPDDVVEQIARWHERAYQEGRAGAAAEQTFDYLGATIVVPPEVMPITPMSHLLGEAVLAEAVAGERVLDMGTGSGVNAILAAKRGAYVTAVDINPMALEAAKENVSRNGLDGCVEVRHSDVFDNVKETFDLIVFDPPFRWFPPRTLFEMASTDEGYRAMTRFFHRAMNHLSHEGRMLIFFGTSGDIAYLRTLMSDQGFVATVAAHDQLIRDGQTVEYYTFKVIPCSPGPS